MSQIKLIVQSLKKILKAHNIRYADVAKALNLSEASVKRLFISENFTLERLEKICALMDIELSELFAHVKTIKTITQLTEEQEQHIVKDIKLLLVATCVVNHWSLADILSFYDISYHECIQKLAFLDKIKILELLPKDRFKLRISANFTWRPNGPIQKFFQKNLQEDFLQSEFLKKDELFIFRFGMLTEESNAMLRKKLQQLAENFTELALEDVPKNMDERHRSVLLLALRPWTPKLLNQFKKK